MRHLNTIADFVRTARRNGARSLAAKLPSNHQLILARHCRQIRNDRCLAEFYDELGNVVRLDNDGIVRQYFPTDL